MLKRYFLTTFFFSIYQLGTAVFSVSLGPRIFQKLYWRRRNYIFFPTAFFHAAYYNVFSYIREISSLQNRLLVLGTFSMYNHHFLLQSLSNYFNNYFLTGMASRFSFFLNWSAVYAADQLYPVNRRRFNEDAFWLHYQEFRGRDCGSRTIGGVILHKYFFRALQNLPKFCLHETKVSRDFFLLLPQLTGRFQLFVYIYSLLKLHLFYKNQTLSRRFFWNTNFRLLNSQACLNLPDIAINFVFRLFGRQHTQMQNWEYIVYQELFKAYPPLLRKHEQLVRQKSSFY